MRVGAILQIIACVYHVFLGVLFFVAVLGVDVFGQGDVRANGWRWLIVYLVALVVDVVETATVLAWTRMAATFEHVHGRLLAHWIQDVLLAILLLNFFLADMAHVKDPRATLQWIALVGTGMLLNLPLELQGVFSTSFAWSLDDSSSSTLSKTADKAHRARLGYI